MLAARARRRSVCGASTIVWANTGWSGGYDALKGTQLGPLDVEHWAADGALTLFFFVAGLEQMREELDKVFSNRMGSETKWQRRKAELVAGERWVELIY